MYEAIRISATIVSDIDHVTLFVIGTILTQLLPRFAKGSYHATSIEFAHWRRRIDHTFKLVSRTKYASAFARVIVTWLLGTRRMTTSFRYHVNHAMFLMCSTVLAL